MEYSHFKSWGTFIAAALGLLVIFLSMPLGESLPPAWIIQVLLGAGLIIIAFVVQFRAKDKPLVKEKSIADEYLEIWETASVIILKDMEILDELKSKQKESITQISWPTSVEKHIQTMVSMYCMKYIIAE